MWIDYKTDFSVKLKWNCPLGFTTDFRKDGDQNCLFENWNSRLGNISIGKYFEMNVLESDPVK